MLTMPPPEAIETSSMAIIDAEVPEPRPFQGLEWNVARRMIHTTADFDLLQHIRFHPGAIRAGVEALSSGCLVVTDTEMARMGIPLRRMTPLGCEVRCLMNDPEAASRAKKRNTTRALAAVDLMAERLTGSPYRTGHGDNAIFVIGNAPTALIRLLELMDAGSITPRLIVGMPVGFVNAAESKDLLLCRTDVPYVTIQGRKGGSALAACVVNQLAEAALHPDA